MKKTAAIAAGILVAGAVLASAGAWYTGTQLEGVLRTSIEQANGQLHDAMLGVDAQVSVELVSLERHFYSSTAHYRITAIGRALGDKPVELLFVDHIEHGPLPFSRLKQLKLMPVMVTSNYQLERNELTEKWFAASKGETPLKGSVSLGYDRSTSGTLELLPLDIALDDTSSLQFSGMNVDIDASDQAEKIRVGGTMDSLRLSTLSADNTPLRLELRNLRIDSDRHLGESGFYLGTDNATLGTAELRYGKEPPLLLKSLKQSAASEESGSSLSASIGYDIGMISYGGHEIGAAQLAWNLKNLDIQASRSLFKLYQAKIEALQQNDAEPLSLDDAQQAQLRTDLDRLLTVKPQLALERVSLKSAHGESHFGLVIDFARPQSFDLPADQLAKQIIGQLDAKLLLSKAMIKDVAAAHLQGLGQDDVSMAEQQATYTADMAGEIALGTELATLEGDNVVANLHYGDGQVDLNGRKMSVEEFVSLVMARMSGGMPTEEGSDEAEEGQSLEDMAPEEAVPEQE
jgi:uncharacterized protein YdgA (DUF945 family)